MSRNRNRQRDRHRPPASPVSRLVGGATVLAVGVIFWLDRLGTIDARDYLQWWPLALIAYGAATVVFRRQLTGIIAIVAGLVFLPPVPFFPHVRVSQLLAAWPLLITAAGVTLAFQALRPAHRGARAELRAIAVMAGSGRKIVAGAFNGGEAVAVMGGCEIDLTHATLTADATIDVLAFWGGIEIVVPRGWHIENRVAPILGGFTDNTAEPIVTTAPRLVIRGSAIMGGIEVRNSREAQP